MRSRATSSIAALMSTPVTPQVGGQQLEFEAGADADDQHRSAFSPPPRRRRAPPPAVRDGTAGRRSDRRSAPNGCKRPQCAFRACAEAALEWGMSKLFPFWLSSPAACAAIQPAATLRQATVKRQPARFDRPQATKARRAAGAHRRTGRESAALRALAKVEIAAAPGRRTLHGLSPPWRLFSNLSRAAFNSMAKYADPPRSGWTRSSDGYRRRGSRLRLIARRRRGFRAPDRRSCRRPFRRADDPPFAAALCRPAPARRLATPLRILPLVENALGRLPLSFLGVARRLQAFSLRRFPLSPLVGLVFWFVAPLVGAAAEQAREHVPA